MSKSNPLKFNWGNSSDRWKREEAVRQAIREEVRAAGYRLKTNNMIDVMAEQYGAKLLFGKDGLYKLNGIQFKDPSKATMFWLKVKQ